MRATALIFALATMMSAQVGNVENAAVFQPTAVLTFSTLNGVIQASGSFLLGFPAISANIISPRMLAVLSYPFPQNPFPAIFTPPVAATLAIRPVGSSAAIPVLVTDAVAGAITFVVPAGVPIGGAELLYKIDNQPTQWTNVNVVQSSFEFFRISSGGPAIAQIVAPNGSLSSVGLTTPAQPGQTLLLTGSGLGYGSAVSATIGGFQAPVAYAGAHPTQAGHDEILIPIPSGVPDGCYVPVTITYNQTTVTTSISKTSDGTPCRHPWQLSVSDMKTLDSGGALADGVVNLSTQLNATSSTVASRSESASMLLGQINAGGIAAYFTPVSVASGPGCMAAAPSFAFTAVRIIALPPAPADLGASVALESPTAAITLAGSNGYYSRNLPPSTDGPLADLPPAIIAGGKWTWQSSGGKDLPASAFGFTLPAPIQLNGGAPISLRRDRDQTITWNGTAFDAGATVNIYLSGNTTAPVTCTASARAGTVNIPASLLSAYAANTIGTLTASLNASGSSLPHAQFQLENGKTLLLVVSYSSSDSRPVAFQ